MYLSTFTLMAGRNQVIKYFYLIGLDMKSDMNSNKRSGY